MYKTRRHWRVAVVGLLLIVGSSAGALTPKLRKDGPLSLLPDTALIASLYIVESSDTLHEINERLYPYHPIACDGDPREDAFPGWQRSALTEALAHEVIHGHDTEIRSRAHWLYENLRYYEVNRSDSEPEVIRALVLSDDPTLRRMGINRVCEGYDTYGSEMDGVLATLVSMLRQADDYNVVQQIQFAGCENSIVKDRLMQTWLDLCQHENKSIQDIAWETVQYELPNYRQEIVAILQARLTSEDEMVRIHADSELHWIREQYGD